MDEYCEKHEWPAGMVTPCPDCAELAAVTKERDAFKGNYHRKLADDTKHLAELQAALLQISALCEALAKVAEDTKIIGGQTPGPLYVAGWNGACREAAERIRSVNFAEKPINEVCWCASTADGKVCPVHDVEKRAQKSTNGVCVCTSCGYNTLPHVECPKCGG